MSCPLFGTSVSVVIVPAKRSSRPQAHGVGGYFASVCSWAPDTSDAVVPVESWPIASARYYGCRITSCVYGQGSTYKN